MAQDIVAPQTRREDIGPRFGVVGRLVRRLDRLPSSPALGPVAYNPALVAYVVTVAGAALAVAFVTLRLPTGSVPQLWPTLALGGVTIFLMSVYVLPPTGPAKIGWTPTIFVHLGLSVALGPIGALVGGFAEPLGVCVRNRNGWFRTCFNVANIFLADITAWAVFQGVERLAGHSAPAALTAGLAAGFAHFALNSGSAAMVFHLAEGKPALLVLRSRVAVLPYSIGYGFAVFAFVDMQAAAGVGGFMALLAPVIVLHVYLIIFAIRSHAFDVENERHQKERLDLLRKEAEASERERTKIAGDLHDGVVQNLAGMALMLSAEASQLKAHENGAANGTDALIELLDQSASDAREAMKDLRTLIIDLAPPTLRREGLQAALLEVLAEIKRKGTNTQLDLPPNLRLRKDRAALIFRVAQEVLRNVAAHAQAKNVTVELSTEDGAAVLSIQDDGKGFSEADVARRRAEGHLGTSAIVDRAEEAGGTLTIDSEPGRGTLVVLTLPI
jgi:signal transduction histidine kinase